MTPARRAQIATNAAAKFRTSHPSKRKSRKKSVGFEDKASGTQLIQELREAGLSQDF
jgi:hypothetical protein